MEEKEQVVNSLLVVDIVRRAPSPSEWWKVLFDYYNKRETSKLSMRCLPCYLKVYQYCVRAILTDVENYCKS